MVPAEGIGSLRGRGRIREEAAPVVSARAVLVARVRRAVAREAPAGSVVHEEVPMVKPLV